MTHFSKGWAVLAAAQAVAMPADAVTPVKPDRDRAVHPAQPMEAQSAPVLTKAEVERLIATVRPCWLTASKSPAVSLVVSMNRDGTPVSAQIKDTARYNADPGYRVAADSAYRAVMNPRCQPWPLPADRYNDWRTFTFNFDPRDS
jgi:hypothetical protein